MIRRDVPRLRIIEAFVVLATIIVGARLVQLQVLSADRFRARAKNQHVRIVEESPTRGSILDREGRLLAVSLESARLFARAHRIDDPGAYLGPLAAALETSESELRTRLSSGRRFVPLGEWTEPARIDAIRAIDGLPLAAGGSLDIETRNRRIYPYGRLGVHVVGYANDERGLAGVEHRLDRDLRGEPAVYRVLRDGRGRRRDLLQASERPGAGVTLTLDIVLQHGVEAKLERAMRETGARAATAIVLDPRNGQVLAMATLPSVDPNDFGRATPDERVDRAVLLAYEPGSTFKIVSMAAMLERGRIDLDERVYCEKGRWERGNRVIRDTSVREWLTPHEIIAYSSNIGMAKLIESLEPQELHDTITGFGFGAKTGIELSAESRGILRPVERWSAFTRASLSFGQEIGVTALQMVSAVGTIANDGVRFPPRIVLGYEDADGTYREQLAPRDERVVSAATARTVRDMMVGCVESGTGSRAAIDGFRVAGKSGTAQISRSGSGYSESEYAASFAGFAPAHDPRVAVLVVLDSPSGKRHQGGRVAAPVFASIVETALRHLRVPSDRDAPFDRRDVARPDPPATASFRPANDRTENRSGDTPSGMPRVLGLSLRQAAARLNAVGCRVRTSGTGFVIGQAPEPGRSVAGVSECALELAPRAAGPSPARAVNG